MTSPASPDRESVLRWDEPGRDEVIEKWAHPVPIVDR